ncbi:hypothetical protein CNY89_04700 [Amaricoccus sp. HAR-UPW-R2A-40]|nr:hypothetical protein CNY89_04700 [Amaricoccus sp. HAR-UPW-R2A-40]
MARGWDIRPVGQRMLSLRNAALYVGLPAKHFKGRFPYPAVDMGGGDLKYDVRDIDRWLEELKGVKVGATREEILGRLE